MRGRGLLVLDLDGTLLVGDGPALDHARELARLLDARTPGRGTLLLGAVEAFLGGREGAGRLAAPDGYLAARRLALEAGLEDQEISAAFRAHRQRMSSGDVDFHAPAGAPDLLRAIRGSVTVALVTNAPSEGLPAILDALGLTGLFDEVVGDAGKPTGLPGIVEGMLDGGGGATDFGRVFAVGDIWENDLAPLAGRGATTGHIDRHSSRTGSPTHRAPDFDGLIPAIRAWAGLPGRV